MRSRVGRRRRHANARRSCSSRARPAASRATPEEPAPLDAYKAESYPEHNHPRSKQRLEALRGGCAQGRLLALLSAMAAGVGAGVGVGVGAGAPNNEGESKRMLRT